MEHAGTDGPCARLHSDAPRRRPLDRRVGSTEVDHAQRRRSSPWSRKTTSASASVARPTAADSVISSFFTSGVVPGVVPKPPVLPDALRLLRHDPSADAERPGTTSNHDTHRTQFGQTATRYVTDASPTTATSTGASERGRLYSPVGVRISLRSQPLKRLPGPPRRLTRPDRGMQEDGRHRHRAGHGAAREERA